MDFLKFDRGVLLPLSFLGGSIVAGLLGAWVGSGLGLVVFLVIFLPIVYLVGYTDLIIKRDDAKS